MMQGITVLPRGIGDGVQFSSLPENYFRATGEKLIDISRPWFFDHNPYVIRDESAVPSKVTELWNFGHKNKYPWPTIKGRAQAVYVSNAEIHAAVFGVPVVLNRPRLYRYEDFPFSERHLILFQTHGKSHGELPDYIIEHVKEKYGRSGRLYHIGLPDRPNIGIPKIETETLWDLARLISQARMVIGPDSGPTWIAACFPDVITKKVRMRPSPDVLKDWVPLAQDNIHSFWDDRCQQIFNPTEDDIGFTMSYKKI
jgi:hypothetical protein